MLVGYTVDFLQAIFLICFGIGLLTSLGALVLGHGHSDGSIGHGGGAGHGGPGHGSGSIDLNHGGGSYDHGKGSAQGHILNLNIILAFLLGFGATGFVARQVWPTGPALFHILLGGAGGVIFAALVYLLLAKVLVRGQSPYLQAGDFDPVGVEGTVCSKIYTGRIGEISFTMNGSLMAMPAKSRDGQEIPKGQFVVVMAVSDNVAVVVPKADFSAYSKFTETT